MAYRGGDLDLRTPRTWSAAASEPAPEPVMAPRARGAYAPGPIWVDETVLACVNHAYDVALAHRSGDVRLEHLLHALTRIDTAAEALEARGVRVAALRRESATVIASELPVGLTNGKASPRHSEELEHVLRAASLIASRRNAPATVEDVLHLILDVEPDLPGLSLLQRLTPRQAPQNEPIYTRTQPPPEPRFVEPPRPAPAYYAEAPRETPPPAQRSTRGNFQATAVDSIQNSRLDALEQMVRALSADLGAERQTFGALLQDLQRDVSGHREDAARISGGVLESLQSTLTPRLQGLEQSVAALRAGAGADLTPVVDRVAKIEQTLAAGQEQFALSLATLENDLRRRTGGNVDLSPLTNRLDIIEEAVLSREGERFVKELGVRLDKLEQAIVVERSHQAEAGAALRGEIGLLAQTVEKQRPELVAALATPVNERLAEFQTLTETRQAEAMQGLRALAERLVQVQQAVGERLTQVEQSFGQNTQKLLESEGIGRDELNELQDALVKLNANQHTLASSLEQWRSEGRQSAEALKADLRHSSDVLLTDVKAYGPRFALLEGEAQRLTGLVDGLSGSMEKMHRVTVERYHRRNRFWYWLFGTDDWVAASWPSQTQRIAEELALVKTPPRR